MNRLLLLPFLFVFSLLHAENAAMHLPVRVLADSLPPAINCPGSISFTLTPGECDTIVNYTVAAYDNEPGFVLTQPTGIATGGAFPIGPTINSFLVTDVAGNTAACSFTITVNNFPHLLICKNSQVIALEEGCMATPAWDLLIENIQPGCPLNYVVELDKTLPFGNGPWVTASLSLPDKNKTYAYRVRNLTNNNMCSGSIVVKDQQGPTMVCENVAIPCEITPVTPWFLRDSLGIAAAFPQISDNCGVVQDTSFLSSLTFVDVFDPMTGVLKFTRRVWTATDDSGNTSSCVQFINQVKANLTEVFFPADITFECTDTLVITPNIAGRPFVELAGHNFPLDACAIVNTFVDSLGVLCGQSRQVFRTWYLLDSETSDERSGLQVIDIQDASAPQVACPAQLTLTVEASSCLAGVPLPDAVISDGCSHIASFQVQWMQGDTIRKQTGTLEGFSGNDPLVKDTLGVIGTAFQFPVGTRQVTYVATDGCGNTGSCQWTLTVLDSDVPLAVCDTLKQVILGPDGQLTLPAGALDSGSDDECLPVAFKARLNQSGACQSPMSWDDNILICCAALGDTLVATLRVYDVALPPGIVENTFGAGHFSECTARIVVTDTFPPLCDNLPDITINCGVFDPTFEAYGNFSASCSVDSSFIALDYSLFDTLCRVGTITRTFNIVNAFGQTAFCLQNITVDPAAQHYYVRFPDDVNASVCVDGGDYGAPQVFQLPGGCENMDISFTDIIDTIVPTGCFEIERRWVILNKCQYNPALPLISVPNPPVMTGPVVSEPGTTGPWASTPLFENIWSANTNGYEYKQIIKVTDLVDPVVESCPGAALTVQDSSNNNTQLWNEAYWLDPQLQITDLCEGTIDLSITANDACSAGDLAFRYLLFLDLDGDNIRETVVDSDNLPGFNAVKYDNYSTPNFSGGTLRQFDERPVPVSQKWGFALQVLRSDTQATAFLRFNAIQSQQTYVLPQLPHGNHLIEWTVTDKCGNQATCSRSFIIRDGKAPDVTCPTATTIFFEENPGVATLEMEDVLWSVADNCSPSNLIETALRLSGTGAGFPATAVQQIDFSCLEDANTEKMVEVWVKDVAGNIRFCTVNIHVDSCYLEVPELPNHIVGTVKLETGPGINDVAILTYLVKDAASVTLADTTDSNGAYDFFIDPGGIGSAYLGGTAAVFPFKNNLPLEGITTFDLVLISKHIIGLDTLDSPYKIIAADANKSGLVTSFDVVELRKLILGIYDVLPDNTTWRFVPSDYVFPDPINPFLPVFPESDTSFYFLNGGKHDFIGLKVGDVNVSADPQMLDADIPERREQVLTIQTNQRKIEAEEVFTATFSTLQPSQGFQFTLNYKDLELLEVIPLKGMLADQFAHFPEKNALTVACEHTEPGTFSLRFRALRTGSLCELLQIGSQITPAAAWLPVAGGKVIPADVALRFPDNDGFALLQNQPNPFSGKTTIRFQLPKESEATLQVFDSHGKVVFSQSGLFGQGLHFVQIDLSGVQAGVLYYQLETPEYRAVEKMVRL